MGAPFGIRNSGNRQRAIGQFPPHPRDEVLEERTQGAAAIYDRYLQASIHPHR